VDWIFSGALAASDTLFRAGREESKSRLEGCWRTFVQLPRHGESVFELNVSGRSGRRLVAPHHQLLHLTNAVGDLKDRVNFVVPDFPRDETPNRQKASRGAANARAREVGGLETDFWKCRQRGNQDRVCLAPCVDYALKLNDVK
jgi:hypothetical protein